MKTIFFSLFFLTGSLMLNAQEAPVKPAPRKTAPSYAPSRLKADGDFGPGHNRRRAKMRKRSRYI